MSWHVEGGEGRGLVGFGIDCAQLTTNQSTEKVKGLVSAWDAICVAETLHTK